MKNIRPQNRLAYHVQRWLLWAVVLAFAAIVLPWTPSDDAPDA